MPPGERMPEATGMNLPSGVIFAAQPLRSLEVIRRPYIIAAMLAALAGIAGYFNLFPGSENFTLYSRARGTFKEAGAHDGHADTRAKRAKADDEADTEITDRHLAGTGGSGGPANIGVAVPPTLPLTLHVRLAATAPLGAVAGNLTISTTDATTQTVALSGTVTVTVNQVTPTVTTWPTATAITYGQTLASSTLSGGAASVAGNFAFTTPGTTPDAGTAAQAVTFTPTDAVNYSAVSGTASVLVNRATATVVLGGLTAVDDGTAKAASATTVPAGLTVELTYDLSATAPSLPGTYAVVATVSDPNYVGSASGSLVISPKGPVFSGYSASTKQNQTLVIARAKILSRASDPYGGKVALPRVFGPSAQGGAVSLVGTNVTYTPATAFVGVDTFEVELTNPAGGITRGLVTITVTGTAQAAQNLGQLTLRDGVVVLDPYSRGVSLDVEELQLRLR